MSVVDSKGFRSGVGIVLCNKEGKVLIARRHGSQDQWQFPQGGVEMGESLETTMSRELYEELGVRRSDIAVLACTRKSLLYRLPLEIVQARETTSSSYFIGQKLTFFLLQLTCSSSVINVDLGKRPEFDSWKWVSYWYPVRVIVRFKREMYRRALTELVPYLPTGGG